MQLGFRLILSSSERMADSILIVDAEFSTRGGVRDILEGVRVCCLFGGNRAAGLSALRALECDLVSPRLAQAGHGRP